MSEQIVTSPIITDETGQDILAAIENLADAVKPNAQGVSFDKTGCAVITTNNVQDGMKQLDSGLDTVSSNLAQKGNIEAISDWGTYATVNQIIQLSKSIDNFKFLMVRSGSNTDQSSGGSKIDYIPITMANNDVQIQINMLINGKLQTMIINFPTKTTCKIISRQIITGGSTWESGIRQIFGMY